MIDPLVNTATEHPAACTLALICLCALASVWRSVRVLARLETEDFRLWQKALDVTGRIEP